jgi:hypothetical protein
LKPDGKKDTLLKYKIDESFFRKYENATLSKMYDNGELITGYALQGEEPYVLPKFTADELIELVKGHGNEFNVPMCEKLAKLFNYNINGTKIEELQQETQPQRTEAPRKIPPPHPQLEHTWVDSRNFFQKYSPGNILREMKKRVLAE